MMCSITLTKNSVSRNGHWYVFQKTHIIVVFLFPMKSWTWLYSHIYNSLSLIPPTTTPTHKHFTKTLSQTRILEFPIIEYIHMLELIYSMLSLSDGLLNV